MRILAVLLFIGFACCPAVQGQTAEAPAVPDVSPETIAKIDSFDNVPAPALFEKLLPLHRPKRKPGPVDWLSLNQEPGQSFYRYFLSQPVRPDSKHTTIYISLLGEFNATQKKIIELTAAYMQIYFSVPVKFHDPLILDMVPDSARRVHPQWHVKQILTSFVLMDILKPRLPENALAYIAFTTSDLWPGEGWHYVFGMAMLRDRVGVWSIARYGDPDKDEESYRKCLMRTLKVGTHETGHMLSMEHCIAHECNMNGSNHLQEMDNAPLALCPICLRKLIYAVKADPAVRYKALAAFCETNGFTTEAAFFKQSLELIAPTTELPCAGVE